MKSEVDQEPASAPATSTVITISSEDIRRDYVTWSLFNTLFMNFCCLGFIAFAYSVKSRDRKMVGDITGAQAFAVTAKILNVITMIFSIVLFIFLAAFLRVRIHFEIAQ